MAKKILLLSFLLTVSFTVFAQQDQAREGFWDRTYFGGSLALQFGTYTLIDISPLMGYGITDRFSTGVGFTYQYVDTWHSYSAYGGRVFSRFGLITNIFLHGEYEALNWLRRSRFSAGEGQRIWTDAVFVGGGYSSHLGGQSGFQAYILYNLTHDPNRSSYSDPYVIRFSITF
jgi:hypothetical protein